MNFPDKPKPFRDHVSIEEFEKYDEKREEIELWFSIYKECGSRVEDRPLIAEVMQSMMMKEDIPRELKMEILKKTYEIIDEKEGGDFNKETARVLIDMVRGENDPALRARMIAILSHDLQQKYFPEDIDLHSDNLQEIRKIIRKIDAFESLTKEPLEGRIELDKKIVERYSKWARFILNPRGEVEVLNALYHKDKNVILTPQILEYITQQTDNIEKELFEEAVEEKTEEEEKLQRKFTGQIIRMAWRFPSREKIEEFERETGRSLPVCFVRRVGKKFYSIDFPDTLSRRAMDYVEEFRNGLIDRDEVFKLITPIAIKFLSRMNYDQRRELISAGSNLEIRFATEKSKWLKNIDKEE